MHLRCDVCCRPPSLSLSLSFVCDMTDTRLVVSIDQLYIMRVGIVDNDDQDMMYKIHIHNTYIDENGGAPAILKKAAHLTFIVVVMMSSS